MIVDVAVGEVGDLGSRRVSDLDDGLVGSREGCGVSGVCWLSVGIDRWGRVGEGCALGDVVGRSRSSSVNLADGVSGLVDGLLLLRVVSCRVQGRGSGVAQGWLSAQVDRRVADADVALAAARERGVDRFRLGRDLGEITRAPVGVVRARRHFVAGVRRGEDCARDE